MNCPFCGNGLLGHYTEERMMFTYCLSCGARGPLVPLETCQIEGRRHYPDQRAYVVACDEAWERRVQHCWDSIPARPDVMAWIYNRITRRKRP